MIIVLLLQMMADGKVGGSPFMLEFRLEVTGGKYHIFFYFFFCFCTVVNCSFITGA